MSSTASEGIRGNGLYVHDGGWPKMYFPAAPVSRYGMRGSLEGFETDRCSNEAVDDVVEDILLEVLYSGGI